MADEFRKGLDAECGVGGVKCSCCNDYGGKYKSVLRRIVRRKMKHSDNKATKKIVEDKD